MRLSSAAVAQCLLLAGLAHAQVTQMPYDYIVAAGYSSALDKVILASSSPTQLAIYDPVAGTGTVVALTDVPTALSVSPDGLSAAVLFATSVSLVNLTTQSVTQTFTGVSGGYAGMVLAANWVHVFPSGAAPWSLRIADGSIVTSATPAGSNPSLSPSGLTIYAVNAAGTSVNAYDISGGPIGSSHIQSAGCAASQTAAFAVPSADGRRVYTGCQTLTSSSNPAQDLQHYVTAGASCAGSTVAESPSAKLLACASRAGQPIVLYDSNYLSVAGFVVAPANSTPYVWWLFWNQAGTSLYVIGLEMGNPRLGAKSFSMYTYSPSSAHPACAVATGYSTDYVAGYGGIVPTVFQVDFGSTCVYQLAASVPWIQVVWPLTVRPIGNTFSVDVPQTIVRANPGGTREGTVTIGSQTILVIQSAHVPASTSNSLGVAMNQSAYDKTNDTLVFSALTAPELHIFSPVTGDEQIVRLVELGSGVSLSPEGSHAAVAHDGFISYVNLGTATVERLIKVPDILNFAIPAANGFIYAFGQNNVWSYELATGNLTATPNPNGWAQTAILSPSGSSIYFSGASSSAKWALGTGVLQLAYTVPAVTFKALSEDGTRLIGANAVYQASDVQSQDFKPIGTLTGPLGANAVAAADSSVHHLTAVADGTNLQINNDTDFSFAWEAVAANPSANAVYWNSAADHVVVAGGNSVGYLPTPSVCPVTLSQTLVQAPAAGGPFAWGGTFYIDVTVPQGCSWAVSSLQQPAQNITLVPGQGGTGPGQFSFSIGPNPFPYALNSSIIVENKTLVIGQSGGSSDLGNVDPITCSGTITGWIADLNRPSTGIPAWIYDGTNYYGPIIGNLPRNDVSLLLGNNKSHGFSYQFSGSLAGTTKTVHVYADDIKTDLPGSPATLTCAPAALVTLTGQVTASSQGLNGVTINVTGSQTLSTTTSGSGTFSFNLSGGTYTVTPALSGYTFSPPSITFTSSTGSQVANFVGTPAGGLAFYPITPCRVADTRAPAGFSGQFGPPSMSGGQTRAFSILSSGCATSIPSNAAAYALNFTVVPPSAGPPANLTTWPAGAPSMPNVSTLNYSGSVVANAAIVPAGTNGAINVFVNYPTDILFDITGYFAPPSVAGLEFYTLTPCRIADTRPAAGFTGQFGAPSMAGGSTRTLNIPASGCGVPATASAYALNFTVVPPSNGPSANLTTWPATQSTMPNVSTLNYSGSVVANAAIVPAGTNNSINVFVNDPTDVLFDINGYFAPPAASGLHFYPVTPCRIADTRGPAGFTGQFGPPTMTGGSTRTFNIPASGCGIPSAAVAYSLNFTVVPPSGGPAANLTTWPTGAASMPNVSTLNYYGSVVANAAIVPAGTNGAISVFVNHATDVLFDINGYFAP